MHMLALPAPAVALLRQQFGLITRAQLVAAGVTDSAITRGAKAGALERVERAVFRLAGAPVPPEQRHVAALLRSGAKARMTGVSALTLLGVAGLPAQTRPMVCVPPDAKVEAVSFLVVRREVARRDRALIAGYPGVTPTRAARDAADVLSRAELLATLDSMRWLRLLRFNRFVEAAVAGPHTLGTRRILQLHAAGILGPESAGERSLQEFLGPLAVHFEWGVEDALPGYRLDAYDRGARLGLEYDGERHHTLQGDIHADRRRELELRRADIEILRITKEMMRGQAAAGTLEAITEIRLRRLDVRAWGATRARVMSA